MNQLKPCAACGQLIVKNGYDNWHHYNKRLTCSRKCAATIRFNKITAMEVSITVAFGRINEAMTGWHPGATKSHELRGTA